MNRWRLHRGGIVNIWQYTEQTFDFSGGRAIFQGTNGSGKSRTLELLLPLCLDGDLRQVGSKGFDTVSLRRLMLDDYDGGPNRIGYAWVELTRDSGEYLTCGLGVKASKTSQAITDSWRFITSLRVGHDLALVGADRTPLGPTQLRDLIGADCVLEEAAFRARVAETVYGVPAPRYGDLLHLQRTLRNPDVGLKVLEGQLEQILSDALPPLDQALVEQLATSFDDLESIRENITRLSSADAALGTFLKTYSDYAFGGLRSAADRLGAAEDGVRKQERASARLSASLEETLAARTAAEHSLAVLEAGEQQAEETIGALKELPAFRDLQDLQTREKLVAEKRSSAAAALDMANKQRLQEDGAVDGVLRLLRRLAEDLGAAEELVEPLRHHLRVAGLDPAAVPDVPRVSTLDPLVRTESVRAKPDPEAEPLPIERRVPPVVEELALEPLAARTSSIASSARQRGALALALAAQAAELDSAQRQVDALRQTARDAQHAATEAAALRNQEAQELASVAQGWLADVEAWRTSGPLSATQPDSPLAVPTSVDPAAARSLASAAREWVGPLVTAARDGAHAVVQRRAELAASINALDAELSGLRSGTAQVPERGRFVAAERDATAGAPFYRLVDFQPTVDAAERAGLEAALEASGLLDAWVTPPSPDTRSGDQAPKMYGNTVTAPRLNRGTATTPNPSDHPPTTQPASQTNAAAAADRSTDLPAGDATVQDVLALPGTPVDGPSLASVLVPAVEPNSPVPATVVADLLASVSLWSLPSTPSASASSPSPSPGLPLSADALPSQGMSASADASASPSPSADTFTASASASAGTFAVSPGGFAVSPDGRWRAGVLTGAWRKDAAEFIGAGAREAARRRRIAELEDELAALRADLGVAEAELAAAKNLVEQWESHLERFPADRELVARHGRLQAAQESAERAARRAEELRDELATAQSRGEAAAAEVVRQAGDAGLPATTEGLHQAQQAAAEAQRTADRLGDVLRRQCQSTVADLTDATHRYHAAVEDRGAAESDAEARCVDYASQASTLAELTDAIGGEAREIADQLSTLERSRREMRGELKGVREEVVSAREQAAKLSAQLETSAEQLTQARDGLTRATEHFKATVQAPGVLVAALPDVPEDVTSVRAALMASDRRGAGETTVITKLQALQTSLAGSHDIAAEQHVGLLTVTVTGEDGARPVAVAARQVTTKLAEQRGFLDEQYQNIFADYLIRDLAEWLRGQIAVAEDLCKRMNEVLGRARSSQGVHVKLAWKPSAALDEGTRDALALVRLPYAERDPEQDATLRRVFTERIEAERDAHTGNYAEILSRALDYRTWHQFTVTVADTGPDGGPRERRLRQLSSGETRLISYVTLFAAAASFYDAVSDEFSPLRLVLLDEAFERLDDPTIARMLGLLVDLDMDWVITWPSGWGVSDKIPRMHIYDVLRPKNGRGVACTQTTWDGAALDRIDP
ncbi:TIGR02680 family protein [Saccharothrix sp. ALI-22-I]|uniref:SbcC/MukB-like Walker B domain-containing protein n=1 Tax=Saccharothrix sp. ALI-22-I TaxID=1933778 RepID=UPI00097C5AA8|nr:SbcC/MukB-like Walker B domain-containing protein [Saccharothrix sp. ALI-22-I]ONI86047.1 TIGR02680 family protein [Saccharothrix sp. ALI-22-I]